MLFIAAIATVALSLLYVYYTTIYIFTFRLCLGFKLHCNCNYYIVI